MFSIIAYAAGMGKGEKCPGYWADLMDSKKKFYFRFLVIWISIWYTENTVTTVEVFDMLPEEDQTLALHLIKKLVLAWDPDYTRATPAEDAAMEQAIKEIESGDYVPHNAIHWD